MTRPGTPSDPVGSRDPSKPTGSKPARSNSDRPAQRPASAAQKVGQPEPTSPPSTGRAAGSGKQPQSRFDQTASRMRQRLGAGRFDQTPGAAGKAGRGVERATLAARASHGDPRALGALTAEAAKSRGVKWSVVAALTALGVMAAMMLSLFSGGMGQLGSETGMADRSITAAGVNGVTEQEVADYQGATSGSKVPWQILAAVRKTAADERGKGWGGVDMKKAPDSLKQAVKAKDTAATVGWFANRLALHVDGYQMREVQLDAGASSSGLDQRFIDASADGATGPAHQVEKVWMGALKSLPLAGNPERARTVFELARTWALGNYEVDCDPGIQQVGTGSSGGSGWANPAMGEITSPFGMRVHPVFGYSKLHDGTDISGGSGNSDVGQPVYAASGGTVTVSPEEWAGPHLVTIDHGNGVKTLYGHMSAATVKSGDRVAPGTKVGEIGDEGFSEGAHLHFMVEVDGDVVDPVPFMKDKGVDLGTTPVDQVAGGSGTSPGSGGSNVVPAATGAAGLPQSWTAKASTGEEITLDRVQLGFAAEAVAKGTQMGASDDALIIMLMTPFPEGGWQNYASTVYPETIGKEYPKGAIGSDHDSVGLWQQRPQSGWGTPAQLLDPAYGASAFLGGPKGPNGGSPQGLLDHPGWESMSKGEAAQDVQVSAFPDKYAPWEDAATELLGLVRGKAVVEETAAGDPCATATSGELEGAYTVASFNALGAHHTVAGGKNAALGSGSQRMKSALAKFDAQGVSVAGLQEMEDVQARTITQSGQWQVHRATPNNRFRDGTTMFNAIAWRTDQWSLESTDELRVRYQSRWLHLPIVTLQSTSGEQITVMNVHNPSNEKGGDKSQWRKRARAAELEKLKELQTQAPVVLTGDMNEKRPSFCGLVPASGGTGCNPKRWGGVDFIFVDKDLPVTGWKVDSSTDGNESDHPLVTASIGSGTDVTKAVTWAVSQVGKGYSQAQNLRLGPTHYDCSGLVYRAFQKVGIELPMTSITQSKAGTSISKDQLQPGDLIFYYSPVSHVSIYIGERNGVPSIVHAANPGTGVTIAPLAEMEGDIVDIRRVTKGESV